MNIDYNQHNTTNNNLNTSVDVSVSMNLNQNDNNNSLDSSSDNHNLSFQKIFSSLNLKKKKTLLELKNHQIMMLDNLVFQSFPDLQTDYNFDCLYIKEDDAKFFLHLTQNVLPSIDLNSFSDSNELNNLNLSNNILLNNQNIQQQSLNNSSSSSSSFQVSNTLMTLLAKSLNNNKPIRLDFDNNVSIILRIDNKGKISAEFLPGDKVVEDYLKQNISSLRRSFENQNIPYNQIVYRKHKKKKNNKGDL